MKATGIIRRIDDLGRVVLPKEIRRTMHISEDDALEFYIEIKDDSPILCLKPYYPQNQKFLLKRISDLVKDLQEEEDWYLPHEEGYQYYKDLVQLAQEMQKKVRENQ